MRRLIPLLFALCTYETHAAGAGMPGPMKLHAASIEHLEWQGASTFDLEVSGWYGDPLNKFVCMIDAHKSGSEETETEFDLGYQTAVSPFWDARAISRYQDDHDGGRIWIGAGVSGTLPYFVHMDSNLLASEGDALLELELLHKIPLNRHWVLESRFEVTGIAGDDSGIEDLSIGMRIGHESVNRLKRYLGVEWQKSPLENSSRTALIAGISYWY